jgi:hypothetical protein
MEQERQQQQLPPQHQLTPVVPADLKAPAVAPPPQQKPAATATAMPVPVPRPWPVVFTPK